MTPTRKHRTFAIPVAALAFTAASPGPASAQTIAYTFSGAVASVTNPSGPWAGVRVGDPIRICTLVVPGEPPTTSTPTSRVFLFPEGGALAPAYATAGPARADLFYSITSYAESAEVVIADDDGAPVVQDLFRGRIRSTDSGDFAFEFAETAPAAPVQTGLTGLGWPGAAALDLSTWDSETLSITGDFGAGPMVITGPIESVMIQDFECWSIDFTEDGLIDFADYLVFLNYFFEQDFRADLCGCGIVDFTSFLIFLQRYDACGGF